MKNSSNFKATIFCLLFLLLNAVQSFAQTRYQYGQSQFTFSHATTAPNLHIVYNKPFSTTFLSPPTAPDFRIEAIIGSVSHKWDLDASGTLSFKYGSGSTTANMMSLNSNGLSVTGKDFSLGGRIEMGEAVTPDNQTGHYLAFGGRNIAANG